MSKDRQTGKVDDPLVVGDTSYPLISTSVVRSKVWHLCWGEQVDVRGICWVACDTTVVEEVVEGCGASRFRGGPYPTVEQALREGVCYLLSMGIPFVVEESDQRNERTLVAAGVHRGGLRTDYRTPTWVRERR